ncbi:hypothetical protein VNO78_12553 [Psophocarpus tetragonolobus]
MFLAPSHMFALMTSKTNTRMFFPVQETLKALSSPPLQLSLCFCSSSTSHKPSVAMYLQFYINENGDKVYTTKKESPLGLATQSAHPARFSPDDKYSRQRVLLKKRFGLLPTQQPPPKY